MAITPPTMVVAAGAAVATTIMAARVTQRLRRAVTAHPALSSLQNFARSRSNEMARFALVDTSGHVQNVVEWDGKSAWSAPPDLTVVADDNNLVGPGWS